MSPKLQEIQRKSAVGLATHCTLRLVQQMKRYYCYRVSIFSLLSLSRYKHDVNPESGVKADRSAV